MALVDAQLVAAMRRTVTSGGVAFRLFPHHHLRPRELTELRRASERYGDYLGLPATLELA